MTRRRFRLGDICRFVKGTYPTLKTEPGPYPLVVTAAYRRTASTFQLDGPAVCIPLISSTGHGDAALHRVHYQEGKFALANLLVALLPNDPGVCSARYLFHLLNAGRNELLVPLMQGTANVSLKVEDIAQVEVPLPPLEEQRRIVARIEELSYRLHQVESKKAAVAEETKALLSAARGQLIGREPGPNWVPLRGFVAFIENGLSPACEARPAGPDEWGVVKVGAVSLGRFDEREQKALPVGTRPEVSNEIRSGDVLMSRANTTELVGACAIVRQTRPHLLLSDKIFRFLIREDAAVSGDWLVHVLKSPALRSQIQRGATGTSPTMKNISKEKVLALMMPPHRREEQSAICSTLDAIEDKCERLLRSGAGVRTALNALLPSILDMAFKGEL